MKHINLIMGCHGHQPVGNFDFVFEEAYERSYKPFLDVLERFPAVQVTLHYTGPLWDWFLLHRPEFVTRLAQRAQAGQIEIMGGGYYEPLLCAIPERDARAQIVRMQQFCETHLGVRPRGMWLTERVWEPHMARVLAQSGVEYAALDDAHFLCSGLRPDDLYGYYMTEEEGEAVKVFPIQEKLRYLIPFRPVSESIDYLKSLATEAGDRCVVVHDDSEKFGSWPFTYESVYEEGWLEEFFQALTDNQEWLHAVTYRAHLDAQDPVGRTYITCASYQEMMAWALPTQRQRELRGARAALAEHPELNDRCAPFMQGGFWRNFLAKYPEANTMQKRMLRVSKRLERLRHFADREAFQEAEKHLHRGQCNCAYWHGQFGGLYLNHLRTAIFQELIRADNALDTLAPRTQSVTLESVDFDGDGQAEQLLENGKLGLFLAPHDGATLFEMDYKPGAFNLLNTLARREEPYHDNLATEEEEANPEHEAHSIHEPFQPKERGLASLLYTDPCRRASLRDHFFPEGTTVEAIYRNEAEELAASPRARYGVVSGAASLCMEATVPLCHVADGALRIRKSLELHGDESVIKIAYDIGNESSESFRGVFCPEIVVNFLTGDAPDRYYHSEDRALNGLLLGARQTETALRHLSLRDEWQALETGFRMGEAIDFHLFPLETISQSECGQERVHQGCVVLPVWPLHLDPGASQHLSFTWYVQRIAPAQDK